MFNRKASCYVSEMTIGACNVHNLLPRPHVKLKHSPLPQRRCGVGWGVGGGGGGSVDRAEQRKRRRKKNNTHLHNNTAMI